MAVSLAKPPLPVKGEAFGPYLPPKAFYALFEKKGR